MKDARFDNEEVDWSMTFAAVWLLIGVPATAIGFIVAAISSVWP